MRTYYQLLNFLKRSRENGNWWFDGIDAYYPFVCPKGSTVEGFKFPRDVVFESLMEVMPWIKKFKEDQRKAEEEGPDVFEF